VTRRALNQAARELLLAQSSDWAFIIKTGTMVDYAVRRTREHLLRFTKLYDQVKSGGIDETWLSSVESRDNLFPEIDYRVYRS
jgi:1,4-alpha-glucan branching enzyme